MSALRTFGLEQSLRGFSPPTKGVYALLGSSDVSEAVAGGELAPLPGSLGDFLGASFLDARDKRALALALARGTVGALDVDDGRSIGTWLDHHCATARARSVVAMFIRVATYAHDPAQDASLALRQLRRAFMKGVVYVDGGWQSFVDPLVARLPAATPLFVKSLDELRREHGDDVPIVLAMGADEARALVSGLPEAAPPVTASCLDLALTSLPDPRKRVCFGLDAPLYFSVHTAPDAPKDEPIKLHVMANGHATRADLERFVDVVQPGWRERLVDDASVRYLSRMVVSSSLARAGCARTPLTLAGRVYFAGDHVDTGVLLADASAHSAMTAARALLDAARMRVAA